MEISQGKLLRDDCVLLVAIIDYCIQQQRHTERRERQLEHDAAWSVLADWCDDYYLSHTAQEIRDLVDEGRSPINRFQYFHDLWN